MPAVTSLPPVSRPVPTWLFIWLTDWRAELWQRQRRRKQSMTGTVTRRSQFIIRRRRHSRSRKSSESGNDSTLTGIRELTRSSCPRFDGTFFNKVLKREDDSPIRGEASSGGELRNN